MRFATVVALVIGRGARRSIMELGVEDHQTQPVDGQRYWFLPANAGVTSPSGSGLDLPVDCLIGNARPLAVIDESWGRVGRIWNG